MMMMMMMMMRLKCLFPGDADARVSVDCYVVVSSADHGVSHHKGAVKDGFGEAVVTCDMPKPSKLSSFDSCQKRLLWTHKEVDFAPHPVVGLVL